MKYRTVASHPSERRPGQPAEAGESAEAPGAHGAQLVSAGGAPELTVPSTPGWSPILEALQDGVLRLDADGRVLGSNRAARDLLGLTGPALSTRRCCELVGHSLDRSAACPFERMRTSRGRELATAVFGARHVELAFDPLVDANGAVGGALCLVRDVTERIRAQESVIDEAALDATLADLAGELLTAGSIEQVEALVLEAARFLTDSPAGAVGFVDATASLLVARTGGAGASIDGLVTGRHSLGQVPAWCADLIARRQPLIRRAPAPARPSEPPASTGDRPGRLLAVPAVSTGVVVALVAVVGAPRDYGERDATRLERLGVLFGLAIQRLQAARALQESETRYRTLVDNQGEGIGIVDPNENFVFANPAGERQFGVGAGGLVGRNLLEFTDPSSFSRIKDQTETRKAGNRSTYDVDIIRTDGARRTLLVTATPRYDADGTFVGTFGIFRDVTERKAAEASVRVSEARSRALYELGQREFATEADLVESALEEAVRLTASASGYFRFVEQPAGTGALLSWSADGSEPAEVTALRHRPLAEATIWTECLRTRAPVVHNERAAMPARLATAAGGADMKRHLCLPVLDRDQIVAVTGVADNGQPYNETDVIQLRLFMDSLWKLIARRRAEQEHQALQQQLQVAQKMEAVGQLAGGVAHDFNNLLAAINGYADVLLEDLPEDSPLREDVEQIRRAGERGAALVRQLLAFGRRQVVMPAALSLNQVVQGMTSLLRRLIGEDVTLVTRLDPAVGNVFADHGQIEQILMNLASNGRDAMPLGGTLTIETANHEIRKGEVSPHVGLEPGPCVLLSVSDTGCGMDADTKARIFEPFYTTKPAGKGTGLGLSTVYGIVQMAGGSVAVQSEVGRGSTFQIALPRCDAARPAWPASAEHERPRGGTETVLITEDEEAVRLLASRILGAVGYRVLTAATGAEALAVAAAEPGPIALLVADVVMPGMSGPELARQLTAARPSLRVLFTSGYTGDAIGLHGVPDAGVSFLPKPFAANELLARVRSLLDEDPPPRET